MVSSVFSTGGLAAGAATGGASATVFVSTAEASATLGPAGAADGVAATGPGLVSTGLLELSAARLMTPAPKMKLRGKITHGPKPRRAAVASGFSNGADVARLAVRAEVAAEVVAAAALLREAETAVAARVMPGAPKTS